MDRRHLLKSLPIAMGAMPFMPLRAFAAGALRAKITDIKLARVKLVQKLGEDNVGEANFHFPGDITQVNIGGWGITEIYTDQGAVGIGPATTPQVLAAAKEYLVGKDPFGVAEYSRYLTVLGRPGHQIEIALWDLCGKLAGVPLYKLTGGGLDRVMPYAATMTLGKGPVERAEAAKFLVGIGFRGVKMRASYATMKQDIELMTRAREAIGPNRFLLVDGNKAGPYGATQLYNPWTYQRALETALEFEKLNTYWFEEPLGKWDYDGLTKLKSRLTSMKVAGGEGNDQVADFVEYSKRDCYDIFNADVGVVGPTMYRQIMDLG
jgi:L-alanine-DL-glutamate epimerase-like enolase superfamily enzyme